MNGIVDQIVITEKTSQANDIREAVGSLSALMGRIRCHCQSRPGSAGA